MIRFRSFSNQAIAAVPHPGHSTTTQPAVHFPLDFPFSLSATTHGCHRIATACGTSAVRLPPRRAAAAAAMRGLCSRCLASGRAEASMHALEAHSQARPLLHNHILIFPKRGKKRRLGFLHFTASWNPSSAVRHASHCPGVIDREMRLGLRSQCRRQGLTPLPTIRKKKEIHDAIFYFATFRSFSTDQVVAADAGALLRIEG